MNLAGVLAFVVATSPLVAYADFGGYLDRSSEAEFTAEQYISCATPEGEVSTVINVSQKDGVVLAWSDDDADSVTAVGPGVVTTKFGTEVVASVIEGAGESTGSLYEVGETSPTSVLGRPATEVSMLRSGTERVRLTIDDDTGALLRTETLDDEGEVFCDRRFLAFEEGADDLVVPESSEVDSVESLDRDSVDLPDDLAGFSLLDSYDIGGATLSYYSDGFFSFGVVASDRPLAPPSSATFAPFTTSAGTYDRAFQPGRVVVTWPSGPATMSIIGDLPLDLVEDVLAELPVPERAGFFSRIWNRLFD